ncbi:MAG: RDD family protein [Planctomycetota bacterium]
MRTAFALPALLLAVGCAGYFRPLPAADGEDVFLVLSGKQLTSRDPETRVYVPDEDGFGEWRLVASLTGAARATAAWEGRLWILYRDNCSAYRLEEGELTREFVRRFDDDWRPEALAAHGGRLWALRTVESSGTRMLTASRLASPGGEWEDLGEQLDLGRSAGSLRAASGRSALWILWRKRDSKGRLHPETLSAALRGGAWKLGPARAMGGAEIVICGYPGGDGLLVVSTGRADPVKGGRRVTSASRLTAEEWSEPARLDVRPREFGSAVLRLGLTAHRSPGDPGSEEALLFVGRRRGAAVFSAAPRTGQVPPDWKSEPAIDIDVLGLEVVLGALLFLAALLVGAGLGIAAVRRKRVFPLMPGQPRPAPLPARVGAWLADNVLVGLVFYAVLVFSQLPPYQVMRHALLFPLMLGAYRLVYYFYAAVFEARLAATPGKLAFGLRVAMTDGHRPTAKAALVRNAFRLLDEALVFPLPGLVMAILSRHAQRLGDVFAGTVVSTAGSLTEIAEDRRRKSDRFGLPR